MSRHQVVLQVRVELTLLSLYFQQVQTYFHRPLPCMGDQENP